MESGHQVKVTVYDPTRGVLYRFRTLSGEDVEISESVERRDPSVYFTIAKALILKTFQLFPMGDADHIQDRVTTGKNLNMFYYNPLVLSVFDTLLNSTKSIVDHQ